MDLLLDGRNDLGARGVCERLQLVQVVASFLPARSRARRCQQDRPILGKLDLVDSVVSDLRLRSLLMHRPRHTHTTLAALPACRPPFRRPRLESLGDLSLEAPAGRLVELTPGQRIGKVLLLR